MGKLYVNCKQVFCAEGVVDGVHGDYAEQCMIGRV